MTSSVWVQVSCRPTHTVIVQTSCWLAPRQTSETRGMFMPDKPEIWQTDTGELLNTYHCLLVTACVKSSVQHVGQSVVEINMSLQFLSYPGFHLFNLSHTFSTLRGKNIYIEYCFYEGEFIYFNVKMYFLIGWKDQNITDKYFSTKENFLFCIYLRICFLAESYFSNLSCFTVYITMTYKCYYIIRTVNCFTNE